jgi:hypothetical protein
MAAAQRKSSIEGAHRRRSKNAPNDCTLKMEKGLRGRLICRGKRAGRGNGHGEFRAMTFTQWIGLDGFYIDESRNG